MPSSTSLPNAPLTEKHFVRIDEALGALIGLITPLHQLLEAQTEIEGSATARLDEMLEALANVTASLQMSADALTRIGQSDVTLAALEVRLGSLEARMTEVGDEMRRIGAWLGTPLPRTAGERS